MRIFLTGGSGQLGSALRSVLASSNVVEAPSRAQLDITDSHAVISAVERAAPEIVIHCAALTDVDQCSHEPELAYRVNALGTQSLALACAKTDAAMVYVSTNEVFDGTAAEPYREWDKPHPINLYGASKAAGEWLVCHLLTRFYIVRTAWLYASGGQNFLHRMIHLADRQGHLRVVNDEVGNPTYAQDLAVALAKLISTKAYGIYHITNVGYCSRYEFALEIMRLSGRGHIPVSPITMAEFRRDSTPPLFAPLANTAAAALGITLRPWRSSLAEFLQIERHPDSVQCPVIPRNWTGVKAPAELI